MSLDSENTKANRKSGQNANSEAMLSSSAAVFAS
jgi:hypothetical protein